MTTKSIIILAAALALAALPAIAQNHDKASAVQVAATPAKAQKYTCEMHPEVSEDKPWKCPKCGMKLISVKKAATPAK